MARSPLIARFAPADRRKARELFAFGVGHDGDMLGVRIFEFDNEGRLAAQIHAETARFEPDGAWTLQQVLRSRFLNPESTDARI